MKFSLNDEAELGSGLFGVVLQGTVDSESVAVKKCNRPPSIKFEARLLKLCTGHKNIVAFKGLVDLVDECYLIMELALGGTLQRHLGENRFTLRQKQSIVQQICSGLQHIHSKGIVHRDIKSENLLFIDAWLTRLVISDFGEADFWKECQSKRNNHDIVFDRRYDYKCDVYLLGLATYQLFEDLSCVCRLRLGDEILRKAGRKHGLNKKLYKGPRWEHAIATAVSRQPETRPTLAEFQDAFRERI